MEDGETPRMSKYGESKTTRIMMTTVPHVTSGLGLRKFQVDGFLLTWVYIIRVLRYQAQVQDGSYMWKDYVYTAIPTLHYHPTTLESYSKVTQQQQHLLFTYDRKCDSKKLQTLSCTKNYWQLIW